MKATLSVSYFYFRLFLPWWRWGRVRSFCLDIRLFLQKISIIPQPTPPPPLKTYLPLIWWRGKLNSIIISDLDNVKSSFFGVNIARIKSKGNKHYRNWNGNAQITLQAEPFLVVHMLCTEKRLCTNHVKFLLSMLSVLLRYSFKPRQFAFHVKCKQRAKRVVAKRTWRFCILGLQT